MLNIAYCTDEGYARVMLVSIISLLENNKQIEELNIYCLQKGICSNTKEEIENVVRKYGRNIYFVDIFDICSKYRFWREERDTMFARILLPELINVERVLYLDCDTIVEGDLSWLDNLKMDNKISFVVQDTVRPDARVEAGITDQDIYFNSGVMLINCKKWKETGTYEKLRNYEERYSFEGAFPDQRPLNAILKSDIGILPLKYNITTDYYIIRYDQLKYYVQSKIFYSKEEVDESLKCPIIIHFSGDKLFRPWYIECRHPQKDRFYYYMKKYKEANIPPQKIPNKQLLVQYIKYLTPVRFRCWFNRIKILNKYSNKEGHRL